MTKYWKLITISTVIIFSIAALYIQSALASKEFPQFVIKTDEGDESIIDDLVLSGDYMGYSQGEPLRIDTNGTNYLRDQSFFNQLGKRYGQMETELLQNKYKSFMRGKESWEGVLSNEATYLAYANIPYGYYRSGSQQFEIAVLNKETDKTISFEHAIPNVGDYYYFSVMHVQLVDNKLLVITENGPPEGNSSELHLYTFNLDEQVLISDDVITTYQHPVDNMGYTDMVALPNDSMENNTFAIAHQKYKESDVPTKYGAHEIVEQEVIIYDPIAKSKQAIEKIETDIDMGELIAYSGKQLYFQQVDGKGSLRIAEYDMEESKLKNNFMSLPGITTTEYMMGEFNIKVHDGHLYAITPFKDNENKSFVMVGSMDTGEIVYKGEIVTKGINSLGEERFLSIHDFSWK
ncbi:hypothetical protein ACLIBG_06055 [Virgibacillus sp. W0181]|uniref:hypothetical protein n=1 Tax=Virgibacillus sp. W0181 TaxID=3391581 RepID=UPI003F469D57